jgi:hypothetical protein
LCARDTLVVVQEVFHGKRQRQGGFAKGLAVEDDVRHAVGARPIIARKAWAEGATAMYRNAARPASLPARFPGKRKTTARRLPQVEAADAGGVWIPRGLCAAMLPSLALRDDTAPGLPLRPTPPTAITLMPGLHQDKAVEAVERSWAGRPQGLQSCMLLMPCGYGKTMTTLMLARRTGVRFLWIVCRTSLAQDAVDAIQEVFPGAVRWNGNPKREPAPGAFRVAILNGTNQNVRPDMDVDALVVSVHTLMSRCETYGANAWDAYGLMVVDEAHMMTPSFMHAMSSIPARRVVGLSATPYRSAKTTRALYWAFGPLAFACRRPKMSLLGLYLVWRGSGVHVQAVADDSVAAMTALCDKDVGRREMLEAMVLAAAGLGRRVLLLAGRVQYLLRIAAGVNARALESTTGWTAPIASSVRLSKTLDPAVLRERGFVVDVPGRTVRGTPCVAIDSDTPLWLRAIALDAAVCVCAHPSLVKVGVSCRTLDTVIIGTPMKDPEQIVGRITRANSVGQTPLVLDICDTCAPFTGPWANRLQAYDFLDVTLQGRSVSRAPSVEEVTQYIQSLTQGADDAAAAACGSSPT